MDRSKSRQKGEGKEGMDMDRGDASDVLLLSTENVQNNLRIVYYCRTFLSIVAGAVAGVLGLTSIKGFLLYFIIMIITSGALAIKAKMNIHSYFDSWNRVVFDGVSAGLMICLRYCAHFLRPHKRALG